MAMIDLLNKRILQEALADQDIEIIYFDEIDSTNNYAKTLVQESLYKNKLIVANSQTSGRGRQEKSFFSPSGTGIYMSILFDSCDQMYKNEVTIRAATACIKAINTLSQKKVQIKWVNDLFFNGKKIGGILTESIGESSWIILGIGINLFTSDFPSDLENIAGSLNDEVLTRAQLISEITKTFFTSKDSFFDIIKYYKENCLILGKEIAFMVNNKNYSGRALDINERGNLVVETKEGKLTLGSGEITLKSSSFTQ